MNELKKRFEEILNKYELTGSYIEGAKRHEYKHYDRLARLHIVDDLATEINDMLEKERKKAFNDGFVLGVNSISDYVNKLLDEKIKGEKV